MFHYRKSSTALAARGKLFRVAHKTVARALTRTETVKGSRFLALVTEVASLEDVEEQLEQARAAHVSASHHTYAWRLGDAMRFSDDGEPGGTAGRPMLEVLLKRELDYTLAVVSRYFGGTKLGAGGLVRAYSGSLAKALDEAGVKDVRDFADLEFSIPFEQMDAVHRLLDDWDALTKHEPDYTAQGLQLSVTLLEDDVAKLESALTEVTRGAVRWLSSE